MIILVLVGTSHDELRGRTSPDRRVLAGLAVPRRIHFSHKPARLVLKPVQRPRQNRPLFVPDDLLVVYESDAQQSVENFPGELRGGPDIGDLKAGNQLEGFRPVSARVAGDGCLSVAFGPVFQVARLGGILRMGFAGCLTGWRPLMTRSRVQAGAGSPLRVQFDSVRRVGDHEDRLAVAEGPRDVRRTQGIAAEDAMLVATVTAKPQVRDTGYRLLRKRRRGIGSFLVGDRKQAVEE